MASQVEIAQRVVEAILSQKLAPGERLGEQDLADLYGVSRTLVREALMQLQARGFVEVRSRKGWYVVEPSIAEAREAYNAGHLRARLAKYHPNVDVAFRGWNDVWLDNDFRAWDISEELAYIRVPILIVQGEDDQYGTVRQIEIAREECYCPVDVALLPGVKHNPAREAPEVTLRNVSDFVTRILHGHEQTASAA